MFLYKLVAVFANFTNTLELGLYDVQSLHNARSRLYNKVCLAFLRIMVRSYIGILRPPLFHRT